MATKLKMVISFTIFQVASSIEAKKREASLRVELIKDFLFCAPLILLRLAILITLIQKLKAFITWPVDSTPRPAELIVTRNTNIASSFNNTLEIVLMFPVSSINSGKHMIRQIRADIKVFRL